MNIRCFGSRFLPIACAWTMLAFLGGKVNVMAQAQEKTADDTYRYNPEGKRDPFFSPLLRVSQEEEAPEGARTPLQRVDIGQLKLVGVILETDEPKALIEDNVGLGYIVTQGTLIGSKGGVIKVIEPKRIVVEEYETDFYGRRQVHERELQLVAAESTPKSGENKVK